MSIIDTLILDRTAGDAAGGTPKGRYQAVDLNRVGEDQAYLAARFRAYGYGVSLAPKVDWREEDIPRRADMDRYLEGLRALRETLRVMQTTPPAPQSMERLTWREANEIEQILADLEFLIDNMAAAWCYAGEIFCGEV